jgi:hypothetical protein
MYRDQPTFRMRLLKEGLERIEMAKAEYGGRVDKVFIADGDALIMDMDHWEPILEGCQQAFPLLRSAAMPRRTMFWPRRSLSLSD